MTPLRIWTVYRHPEDYPGKYVARLFEVDGAGVHPTNSILVAGALELLQQQMEQMNMVRIARSPGNDPMVVETWL